MHFFRILKHPASRQPTVQQVRVRPAVVAGFYRTTTTGSTGKTLFHPQVSPLFCRLYWPKEKESVRESLFRNERFMVDEMTHQNASKYGKGSWRLKAFHWVILSSINLLFLNSGKLFAQRLKSKFLHFFRLE